MTPTDPDAPVYVHSHIDATTELRVSLDVLSTDDVYATLTLEDLDPAGRSACLDLGDDPERWWALATMAGEIADALDARQGREADAA